MRMRILLQETVGALPTAVVSIILLGGYDPVPAELLEVDHERVSTAPGLLGVLGAVHAESPPCPLVRVVPQKYFYVGHLEELIQVNTELQSRVEFK